MQQPGRMPLQRTHRQRGFSLIIVFLIIVMLIGIGGAAILSTQTDLAVAGRDREAAVSLYAAEAGIAFGKDWLFGKASGTGAGAWNSVLTSAGKYLCVPGDGTAPGTVPNGLNTPTSYDAPRGSSYVFCFHNNALDPNYFLLPPTGDTTDGEGVIVIESYGYGPANARTHLTAEIRNTAVTLARGQDYSQGSSGTLKQASGETGAPGSVGQGVSF